MKKKLVNKRIVIDARMINDSGIGTYLKNILPFLFDEFDIVLLGNKNDLLKYFFNYKFQFINFNAPIYSIKEQFFFPFIIPNCEIFWSPHFNSPIFPVKAKKRICTIHDINHLVFDSGMSKVKKLYAQILYYNSLKRSEKIITVSNFSKQEIINYFNFGEEKVNVIYCGVSQIFFSDNYPKSEIILPEKYILFVGNVKPHKNLITLLKSYQLLPENIKDEYKLVILGKNEGFITPDKLVSNFVSQHNLINNIVFTGFIDDKFIPEIYAKATLFVFPSLYEGFGLPLLEAMASKTIVLSSDKASLNEIGLDNILYFNPLNELDLMNKISLVLNNLESPNDLILKAYNYTKSFSWKKSAEKHISFFKSISL